MVHSGIDFPFTFLLPASCLYLVLQMHGLLSNCKCSIVVNSSVCDVLYLDVATWYGGQPVTTCTMETVLSNLPSAWRVGLMLLTVQHLYHATATHATSD